VANNPEGSQIRPGFGSLFKNGKVWKFLWQGNSQTQHFSAQVNSLAHISLSSFCVKKFQT
jgi:hypothetical protein